MERIDSWTPESPFLEAVDVREVQTSGEDYAIGEVAAPWAAQAESPFSRDSTNAEGENLAAAEFVHELLSELEDEGFTPALYEMAAEAEQAVLSESPSFTISQEVAGAALQQRYERHFALLVAEAERMHNAVAEGFANFELSNASEAELEAMVARFVPSLAAPLPPAQEQFLGKLVRTVGRAVAGAVRFVKNGVQAVGRGIASVGRAVIMPLLRRLGALIKPMIRRVIQFMMGKLPPAVRPIAQTLGRKLFGASFEAETAPVAGPMLAAPTAEAIQMEYNLLVAEAILVAPAGEQEHENFLNVVATHEAEGEDVAGKLHEATQQLALRLAELKEGEDPRPAIQQFLPAALLALQPIIRTVIGIIGRDKVVNFLAGLLAKLVSRWIGEGPARALATPLVSVGLGALGFEQAQNEEPRSAAAQMLAQTLQETVLSLVQQPAEALEQPEMLQALALEAFEAAATANFPPDVLRPELREDATELGGRWVLRPSGQRRKYYKKFSRVFEVKLNPGALRRARTFAGASVADWLAATTGIDPAKPPKAKIHIYELTMGSRLVDISRLEQGVNGLGSHLWTAWGRLMPLTPEVAAELLPDGMAGLGRQTDPAFLQGPYLVAPGQRFYFIEFPGQAASHIDLPNDIGVIINLIRGAITVKVRLSERTAQEIATYLRRRDIATPIQIMRRTFGGLEALSRGQLKVGFRVEGEAELLQEYLADAAEMENLAPAAAVAGGASASLARKIGEQVLSQVAKKLVDLLWAALARYFANKAADFIAATENPASGVTVVFAFGPIDVLRRIGEARRGNVGRALLGTVMDRIRSVAMPITRLPMPSIAIHAGRV
ncbi:MAG: hypothetical protein O9333_14745 [Beijerinckiaceae bacterium]|jgi:hypothetical protein|nr:hypothetical protein [Beijerinckiaceae bacterium]